MTTDLDANPMTTDVDANRNFLFSFGLWTVGNRGGDPFGAVVRGSLDPCDSVRRLGALGASGVCFHDDDLIPPGSTASERDSIVRRFMTALTEAGVSTTMATTNLFYDPVFRDGAFTSNDPRVRRYAVAKVMRGLDLAADLGAPVYVFWGGREGVESLVAKDARLALDRYKEAIDFLCGYVLDQGYPIRFALEPKPNEPRGDLFLPTVGHALAFIARLEHSEMVGVNPEMAHDTMAGLSFTHAVSQALWAGKLFHIDLNGQKIGRYDQDLRFGSVDLVESFHLVRLLESSGYQGPLHFDAHPYRTEDAEGVWDFAAGCMRTYRLLAEKARRLDADSEFRDALAVAGVADLATPTVGPYSSRMADGLRNEQVDLDQLRRRGYRNEHLDQLVTEVIMGTR